MKDILIKSSISSLVVFLFIYFQDKIFNLKNLDKYTDEATGETNEPKWHSNLRNWFDSVKSSKIEFISIFFITTFLSYILPNIIKITGLSLIDQNIIFFIIFNIFSYISYKIYNKKLMKDHIDIENERDAEMLQDKILEQENDTTNSNPFDFGFGVYSRLLFSSKLLFIVNLIIIFGTRNGMDILYNTFGLFSGSDSE